ncbi:hypothetical protein GGU11DRAFT_742543 [Lentinula aff. detonsa]|uniref:Uncharacterized protein n=1 Tax=Lentinula aff. detonsa TaxID=2804958 RepID=A0AA38KU77_9AGAR|nr:hypothetical protein GGU10DRAFT_286797 [Lentinula aff. detonsa]KAJ3800361.1 hypothetical protein GGU11DRAFT_742543 [Lentinula aff. detonsa]
MPVGSTGNGPSYISSHSADVILSDIRPIKLKIEGLRCINVFLDEFLYGILNAAHSLTTDKLRAGLLNVLPTALGKEALLEAEVELRAYWDRTKPSKGGAVEDDTGSFNLQWAFELLRLKCEAYSTLNESDGDKSAESKLQDRLAGAGQPPKPSLVAPAALYLTAILEAMCEHVLSNVGRVASRDSSRTYANVQDVFVALCEDETVYNLFKSMDVYEQIQQLSQEPKPRRSKSLSRNEKNVSRSDQSSGKDSPSPPTNSRLSLEGLTPGSNRSSMDRARGMKKLINGRNSSSNESNGHKRSESTLSDETKQAWAAYNAIDAEEQASLEEFDNLMKSEATMKVSLTPDRLKTMEVYKQEKDQRGGRPKPPPLPSINPELDLSTSSVPPRQFRRPSVPNVSSIVEDEEESSAAKPIQPRTRQISVASPPPKFLPIANVRARSQSAAAPPVKRKTSKTAIASGSTSPPMPTREFRMPQAFDGPGVPQRTRKVQRNRESLDLDDIMAGSDDEELDETELVSPSKSSSSAPGSARVSARTRELMDFLNEGPPPSTINEFGSRPTTNHTPVSKAGRDLIDFLAEGPPDFGPPQPMMDNSSTKSKGSGRLQRMISKLKLGESDKTNRQPSMDDFRKTPTTPSYHRPPLMMKASNGSLSTLGNRPIPPRPLQTQMISPPSSPAHDPADVSSSVSSPAPSTPRIRQPSAIPSSITRKASNWDQEAPVPAVLKPPQPAVAGKLQEPIVSRSASSHSLARSEYDLEDTKPLPNSTIPAPTDTPAVIAPKLPIKANAETKQTNIRVSPPTIKTSLSESKTLSGETTTPATNAAANGISITDAQDMKRLMAKAASPEECRLIMDIFMAKAGIPIGPTEYDVPYPSPSSVDPAESQLSSSDTSLEISLVELFLGGEPSYEPPPRKKRYTTKKVRVDTQAANYLQKPIVSAVNGNAMPSPNTVETVALKA